MNNNIVKLNVYDLNEMNDTTYPFGFGAFHSGVEIFGREYTFAKGGIFYTLPKEEFLYITKGGIFISPGSKFFLTAIFEGSLVGILVGTVNLF